MVNTVDDIRLEYALAYSASLQPGDPAKMQGTETADEYTTRWCTVYKPDMAKIVVIAEATLANLADGGDVKTARRLVYDQIRYQPSMIVQVLLDRIPPLRNVLLSDRADEATFKGTMELIVQAFGEPRA